MTLRQGAVLAGALLLVSLAGWAERVSDVASTRHNLSASGPGTVKASAEDEVCVFCHTPHGATNFPGSPLWNRTLSNQTYTVYTSSSLDAEDIMGQLDQPGGSSKLCLSCHDGTLAIGTVNVLGGQQDVSIPMIGVAADGSMAPGEGTATGFTRDLGVDLRNDHPISLTYDATLAGVDTELVDPVAAAHIGVRGPGIRPSVPLEATGAGGAAQVQCASCHDPHIRDTDPARVIKFLRHNRFQEVAPLGATFNPAADIVCLACHEKDGWESSAHAAPAVANETYTPTAAALREFPAGLPVWQAACLNCHDTHSVHGSRRLLREGTDSQAIPKSGGNPAIEETCFQCHSATPAVANAGGDIRDIATDFSLPRHMPLTSADQPAGDEVHDISDADFSETRLLLGKDNLNNRHAECTDCHNPHRVTKNALFNETGSVQATHAHAAGHSNIASGALRGSWGVEPLYGSADFPSLPSTYLVKQGDGGSGASSDVNSGWVTREYQICLKCHSDYGYADNNAFPTGTRPNLGTAGGGTPPGTNGLTQYTNQAMEFQAPLFHKGEVTTTDSGAGTGYTTNNHRSWHPVIDDTGRTAAVRNMSASTNLFLSPWDGPGIGSQTMYCSDCHGSNTAPGTAEPGGNQPWGPHGSGNDFILKGAWDSTTGSDGNGLCFKCHNHTNYATEANEGDREGFESGFGGPNRDTNLHAFHAKRLGRNLQCMWCHVAVPHGWKNKALLVNLNDVGAEAGLPAGTEIAIGANTDAYNQEPYYYNAKLKVRTFATSGNWEDSNCGSAGASLAGNNTLTGKEWMREVCENPP